MNRLHGDDLFQASQMSFGEHLEELRRALVKASLWLAAGTLIGLLVANYVVKLVAEPFRTELKRAQLEKFSLSYAQVNDSAPSTRLLEWMSAHSLTPEPVYVMRGPQTTLTTMNEDSSSAWLRQLVDQPDFGLERQVQFRQSTAGLKSFGITEGFMVYLKAALLVGAVLASPGIFWHLWSFLAAGLYPHERRLVYRLLPLSVSLFIAGVLLAFFVIIRFVIAALFAYSVHMDADLEPRLSDCMSFALLIPLAFGIAFQLPVVMLALDRFGIVSAEAFATHWRTAVLVLAFLSMVLTPAEFYSMLGMFIPLTLLYFGSIQLCRLLKPRPREKGAFSG